MTSIFSVVVLVVMFAAAGQNADEYCREKRCRDDGPIIRFPFWLKHDQQQPDHCGYPGFELSCSKLKDTVMEFKYHANTSQEGLQVLVYVKAFVIRINYTSQQVFLGSNLLPTDRLTTTLNSSAASSTPFRFSEGETYYPGSGPYNHLQVHHHYYIGDYSLFSCSSTPSFSRWEFQNLVLMTSISGGHASKVYIQPSEGLTFDAPILSCTKIYTISSIPYFWYPYDGGKPMLINWTTPNCGKCEAKGEYCKMDDQNINSSNTTTTCFPIPAQPPAGSGRHASNKAVVARRAGIIPSVILVTLVLVAVLYYLIKSNKRKKEDQLKIEMFLEDYKAMKPTRYSYADIKKITGHFNHKLGQGGFGSVYKGQISEEILVAVKVLNGDSKSDGEEFINEVGTIGRIHHVNVVRLVGYCADGCNRALVYEFQPNKSLEKYVYSEKNHTNNIFLGWEKMQEIALGIAKGIEYLHQGCAQRILHFDIKPHNILLDQNFHPKISDFGLAKLCSKDESIVSITMARGTIGYIAPEVFSRNFGKVSPKSDVYSFGMLLIEMVGGRNSNNNAQNTSESYFPEWIFHRLEQGGEVTIQVDKEDGSGDSNIARKLTIVGLWCIGWHPVDRPSMKHVIQMLEREDCPVMPPNPFNSATSARPFTNELQVISESE